MEGKGNEKTRKERKWVKLNNERVVKLNVCSLKSMYVKIDGILLNISQFWETKTLMTLQ